MRCDGRLIQVDAARRRSDSQEGDHILNVNVNAAAHEFWLAPHTSTSRIHPNHSRPPINARQRALTTC